MPNCHTVNSRYQGQNGAVTEIQLHFLFRYVWRNYYFVLGIIVLASVLNIGVKLLHTATAEFLK